MNPYNDIKAAVSKYWVEEYLKCPDTFILMRTTRTIQVELKQVTEKYIKKMTLEQLLRGCIDANTDQAEYSWPFLTIAELCTFDSMLRAIYFYLVFGDVCDAANTAVRKIRDEARKKWEEENCS